MDFVFKNFVVTVFLFLVVPLSIVMLIWLMLKPLRKINTTGGTMNNMKNSRKDLSKLKSCIHFGRLPNINASIRNILTARCGKKRDRKY